MNAPTLIQVPSPVRRGEVITLRATIAHPMETGQRVDALGQLVPRRILTRFECRRGDELVFAADLHPAISANPYLSFTLLAEASTTLEFLWRGDGAFEHRQTVDLVVT